MELVMLGTGAADGWPNPFCTCPSCLAALSSETIRGHTAALVDNRILWIVVRKYRVPRRDSVARWHTWNTSC